MTDKSRELMGAWIDWQIDKQRYPWYIEEVERIRRKYESTDSKS